VKPEQFVFEEAFNMLCGDLLGEGICRKVYECKIDKTIVVKVEKDPNAMFQNAHEYRHWTESQFYKKAAAWLAPCISISTYGTVLLQRRVQPLQREQLPAEIPEFLNNDIKPSHFGMLDGRVVCCDYALLGTVLPMRMKRPKWDD
jgi:hypothetical protein